MDLRRAFLVIATTSVASLAIGPMVPLAESSLPGMPGSPTSTTTAIAPMSFGSPSPVLMPRMRQSVAMSYASDGTHSVSQSFYTNEMSWRLSDPLTLHLDLGIMAPLWSSGYGSAELREQTPVVLPRLGLEWRPSPNTMLLLSVSQGTLGSASYEPWSPLSNGSPSP